MNINVKTKTKNQTPNYYFFQPELPYIGFFIFLTNKCLCRWWSLCRQESTSKDKIWLQERYNRILYRWHNYHRRLTYFCIKVSIYSSLYCRRKQKKNQLTSVNTEQQQQWNLQSKTNKALNYLILSHVVHQIISQFNFNTLNILLILQHR
jgi:hypothetical protein